MSPAPKNPRRSALLGVLFLVGAVLVWRLGKPSPPANSPEAIHFPTATENSMETPSGAASTSAVASAVPERPAGPVKREGVDAANLYADTFVLFNKLTDAEKAMIRKPGGEVDAEQAAQLNEKIQAIMELLRAAARADYCDWGTGEITFDTGLPHIGKAADLGKLALWAAGYRFATDPSGAIDDLSVRAKLGHHLSDTLLGVLVEASFETSANKLLQDRMSELDAVATAKAIAFVNSSSLETDLERGFAGEMTGAESFGMRLAGMDPVARGQQLASLAGVAEGNNQGWLEQVKHFASGVISGASQVEQDISLLRAIYAQAPAAIRGSEAEFQSWWKRVSFELAADHPLARLTLPALDAVQAKVQQLRVERTLLTAGADILQHGPAQLGRYRDPATGGALQYVATPTGFELRSPYLAKGKAVTMTFSRP